MKTLICNCNRTMPLDGAGLEGALDERLDGPLTVHTTLCRRDAGAFQRAAKSGDELLVACTQEQRLFQELNEQTEGAPSLQERPIRFVNIRETAGWSAAAREKPGSVTPKIAALLAAAQLPDPEPVTTVTYKSAGRVLVIGRADAAQQAAELLSDRLDVTLLLPQAGGALPQARTLPVLAGRVRSISGWLGAFEVQWTPDNPIDLDLCTRCNACIDACPEGAIDFSYQINLEACTGHRACVRACEAVGAIDFDRQTETLSERFDLILDLGAKPLFSQHQPPQGYFHAADASQLTPAVLRLRELVGEFEKPRFFQYKSKLCAHSRNEREGCTACIDVCSARAVSSERTTSGGIKVNPNLCVGCGACTTVCPSGALSYAYPRATDQGTRLRTLLSTYRAAGGRDAALLLHSQGAGAQLIAELGREAQAKRRLRGLPARVLPVDLWHTASAGLDLWLSAIAYGASQVWVLMTAEEAPEYREAVAAQIEVAQAILSGLGYDGSHLRLIEARDAAALDVALQAPPAQGVYTPASFAVQADKRNTLDLALDHLLGNAPVKAETIPLPAASPFGSLIVDTERCTLCLSCVGACPEGALADNAERPQLRFIEKNCVQCGLCAGTCPENAITLDPRLWLADGGRARRQARVMNEAKPFECVRCGKPFGTLRAIEAMMGKLAGHAMFQGKALERLKMCGDCRVIDIHTNSNEVRITDL